MQLSPDPRIDRPLRCSAVALLIDGENMPASCADWALAEAQRLGPLSVLRVYGNARELAGWPEMPGFRFVHAYAGKNITDMLMSVEAMELSYSGGITGFALASNDRDFTPLAQSLRARGIPVLGLTGPKAPEIFRKACTVTVLLPQSAAPAATPPPLAPPSPASPAKPGAKPAPQPVTPTASLDQVIRAALASGPKTPTDFGQAMARAGVKLPKGYRRWRSYLQQRLTGIRITGDGQSALYSLEP